jgi:hypothetical protein
MNERAMERLNVGVLFVDSGVAEPLFLCEQGAKLRGLDLTIAASDAVYMFKNGWCPLRRSPRSGTNRLAEQVLQSQENAEWEFMGLVASHCARVRSMSLIGARVLEVLPSSVISSLSKQAVAKMRLMLSDGDYHSFSLCNESVIYEVNTVPCDLPDAPQLFHQHFGGYMEYIAKRIAHERRTFCHILWGLGRRGSWAQVGVFPTLTAKPKSQDALIPIDLLTSEDRQVLKL